jgi:hypothetical protein
MKRLYALHAFGFPSHPFPKFYDSYPTLTHARNTARDLIRDGWREVEILRDLPRKPENFGIEREHIETINA